MFLIIIKFYLLQDANFRIIPILFTKVSDYYLSFDKNIRLLSHYLLFMYCSDT